MIKILEITKIILYLLIVSDCFFVILTIENLSILSVDPFEYQEKPLGGTIANRSDWEFMAVIVFGKEGYHKYLHAVGTLIKPNLVVTVATMVLSQFIKYHEHLYGQCGVRLGSGPIKFVSVNEINPKRTENDIVPAIHKDEKVIQIKEIIIHPNKTKLHLGYIIADVALVILNEPQYSSTIVELSRIPSLSLMPENLCRTAGWLLKERTKNTSTDLRELTLSVLNKEACLAKIDDRLETAGFILDQKEIYYERKICSLQAASDKLFSEEKGNPLICNNNLQGIALRNYHIQLENNYMSEYEDLSPYYYWIAIVENPNFTTTTYPKKSELERYRNEPIMTLSPTFRSFRNQFSFDVRKGSLRSKAEIILCSKCYSFVSIIISLFFVNFVRYNKII